MRKFHHIGLFVKDLAFGLKQLEKVIEIAIVSKVIADENLLVLIQFVTDASGVRYELVAPFGDGNPVESALKAGKNILNHIAYVSHDFDNDIVELSQNGAILLGLPKQAKAFDGRRVCFLLTKLGFIFELVEGVENVS